MHPDEKHASIRKYRPPAFADFMDEVYRTMPTDEKAKLPADTEWYVNDVVAYALANLPELGDALVKAIRGVYVESPGGERFILDPIRTSSASKAMLFLDPDGELITVVDPALKWVENKSTGQYELIFEDYQSYEILTGTKAGEKHTSYSRPIATELQRV